MTLSKKESLAKNARRDIATLIERGKVETAKIQVETIINEDVSIELLELLSLYVDTLMARFALLETSSDVDPAIGEAVGGIIFAASSTEIKELLVLKDMLMLRFGRDISHQILASSREAEPGSRLVSDRLFARMPASSPPGIALVTAYLKEIANAYGLRLPADEAGSEVLDSPSGNLGQQTTTERAAGEGSAIASNGAAVMATAPSTSSPKDQDFDALQQRFSALKKR